jgi:hypothetical protein
VDNRRVNEIEALHARAVAEGRGTYVDPETGYEVFTAAYLRARGTCCGSACRHCPFDHENVEPAGKAPERLEHFSERDSDPLKRPQ